MMLTEKELLALAEISETGTNEFEYHVFSDEHLEEFARAVIAENNKKVLADLKPMHFQLTVMGGAGGHSTPRQSTQVMTAGMPPVFYTADQVAALIQELDALSAKVKELEKTANKYNDLIMCVSMKTLNESRHDTAKRYILQCESYPLQGQQTLKATS